MGPLTDQLRDFLDTQPIGVVATVTSDGKPRQSVTYFVRDGDALLISTLTERFKARDVMRTGWASVCVMGHEPPYPSAAFSGPAEIVTQDIGPPTARLVQRMTRAPEPPEPMTDAELAEVGRVILRVKIELVTAVSHLDAE